MSYICATFLANKKCTSDVSPTVHYEFNSCMSRFPSMSSILLRLASEIAPLEKYEVVTKIPLAPAG